MNLHALFLATGYIVLFFGILLGISWWDRRRQRTRKPFPENLRLPRMPGEHLWRQIIQSDETDLQLGILVMAIPILVGSGTLYGAIQILQWPLAGSLVVFVLTFTASLLLCARWFQNRWRRRANMYLGLIGERYVAEWLDPLKHDGWFVFHDVPCEGETGRFNLDHVAVGPGGIWVVETKTHRKGRARPGFKEHEVCFDGNQIVWPWGEDRSAIQQAAANANWLRNWLKQMTGQSYEVFAVLTFPGYCVTEKKLGPVRIVNPKVLTHVLQGRGEATLDPAAIDLVRRQLEAKCRDVES